MKTKFSKFRKRIINKAEDLSTHLAITAVAGAGKTTLLVAMFERLQAQVAQILVVNTTKKAGREIRSKLADECVTDNRLNIRTFHSLAFELISRYPGTFVGKLKSQHFRKRPYKIPGEVGAPLDTTDCVLWLFALSNRLGYGYTKKELEKVWEKHYNNFVLGKPTTDFAVRRVWKDANGKSTAPAERKKQTQKEKLLTHNLLCEFEKERLAQGRYCFYDTPILAAALLRKGDVAMQASKEFPVLAIDESQDISPAQFRMALRIANAGSKLIIVGDPRQFINKFMGATNIPPSRLKKNLLDKLVHVQINKSLRCTESVARAVRGIESQMLTTKLKPIVGGNKTLPEVTPTLIDCPCATEMALVTAQMIARDIESGIPPHEIVVNYRFAKGNTALTKLKSELRNLKINYIQMPMAVPLLKQVRNFIALLKVSENPDDEALLVAALTGIKGISIKTAS